MDLISLFIISTSLTFDTLAVSISTGLVISHIRFWQATKLAIVMAIFQGLMPLIGWFIGSRIQHLMADFDHWIAFGLLAILGIKIIYDTIKNKEEKKDFNPLKPLVLIAISIATSIDALIVGFSFGLVEINISLAVLLIGFLTYLVAMLGMLFGKTASHIIGPKIEVLGGIILIGIGLKILLEHTLFMS